MELESILRILVQKWKIIVPIFIITFVATIIYTLNQPRIYEAKATYIAKLSPTITDNREFASVINILSSRIEISTTYAEVANSRRLKTIASQKLNLPPEVVNNLSVSSRLIPGTNIIEIAVQGPSPVQVRDFANTIGASTIDYVQNLYETFTLTPLDEAGIPRRPIQPKVTLNLVLGGILGLVLGISTAFLAYFYQTSGKDSKGSPSGDVIPEAPSAYALSIMDLRQDMTTLHEKFETTRHQLNQIQAALRKTNSYAKDIHSAVNDLEQHFDGNHTDVEKDKREQMKTK